MSAETEIWDTVIIGGGAAGLSAGVVLARARFATLVVDGGTPRNGPAAHMHGYLSRDGMPPAEFLATGRAELARYDGKLVHGSVGEARRTEDGTFELRLRGEGGGGGERKGEVQGEGEGEVQGEGQGARVLRARSVLVATGLTDELPDIPGLAERWASEVHHCPHCHGYEVRGQDITVIGSANGAGSKHLAALMRRYSPSVTFCVNGVEVDDQEARRLEAYGVRLVDGAVRGVGRSAGHAGQQPVEIEIEGGGTVECGAVFVAPRPVPHDEVLTMLGADRDPASGLVAVDAQGATSCPGVWAAGNVVNPRAQVVTAAGAGSAAAISMSDWLLERELAVAERAEAAEAVEGGERR